MTNRLGCCGNTRPISIAGLLERADQLPSSSPQGRAARARLAYAIVAGKAAQTGNRPMYSRAMSGLASLGEDTVPLTTHGAAATDAAVAAAPQIQATVQSLFNQASPAAGVAFTAASQWINGVVALMRIGTAIGGAAGGDPNALRIVNMILSWVRMLTSGSAPRIPELDAATVRGLVDFCAYKDIVVGITNSAFIGGISLAEAAENAGGASALETLRVWVERILNGICEIQQIVAASTALSEEARVAGLQAQCFGLDPNSSYRPEISEGNCVCNEGYSIGTRADGSRGCVPAGAAAGVPITLTREQQRRLQNAAQVPNSSVAFPLPRAVLIEAQERAHLLFPAANRAAATAKGSAVLPLAAGAAALFFLLK